MRRLVAASLLVGLLLLATPYPVHALDVPPKPTSSPVVDQTNTLTAEQQASLSTTIAEERAATGNQIGILMIPSLEGEVLEEYSIKVARDWGIGSKEQNNGVLLLVAKKDRQLRIEVGYGLEGSLTDARASRIIRDRITPEFKNDNYYAGINSGLQGIVSAIHNEVDPALQKPTRVRPSALPWDFIIMGLIIIPTWIGAILARSRSWWAGGVIGGLAGIVVGILAGFLFAGVVAIIILAIIGLLFDRAVSKNYQSHRDQGILPSWWAGGRFGGGSGGFGGFGGGGFGGGGSSGSW